MNRTVKTREPPPLKEEAHERSKYNVDSLHYDDVQVLALFLVIELVTLLYLAWRSTGIEPLQYDLFLVEMQTWPAQRFVQVLHVGYDEALSFGGDLIQRVRQLAHAAPEGESVPIRMSDTNVVIQSPATVVAASHSDHLRLSSSNRMRMWEVEFPTESVSSINDSELAAVTAVAVVSGRRTVAASSNEEIVIGNVREITWDNTPVRRRRTTVPLPETTYSNIVRLASVSNTHHDNSSDDSSDDSIVDGVHTTVVPTNSGARDYAASQSAVIDAMDTHTHAEREPATGRMEAPQQHTVHTESTTVPVDSNTPSQEGMDTKRNEQEDGTRTIPTTCIKLKFLDDTQKTAPTEINRSVGDFKKEFFADAMAENKVVRLIFRGQLLRDDCRTLESYGLHDQCIVHCHVSNTPYANANSNASSGSQNGLRQRAVRRNSRMASTGEMAPSGNMPTHNQHVSYLRFLGFLDRLITPLLWSISGFSTGIENYIGLVWAFARGFASSPPNDTEEQAQTQTGGGWNYPGREFVQRIRRGWQELRDDWDRIEEGEIGLEAAAEAASRPRQQSSLCIGDFVLWIFTVQFACVWAFVYWFPQLCDRVALSLLVLLTLYFFFVVCRHRNNTAAAQASSQQQAGQRSATVH